MMTTMAALLGTLPIAIGLGAGAESRRPLGLAVVGGLLFSQTLTLYVTPVVYLYMDSFQRKLGKLGIFQIRKKRYRRNDGILCPVKNRGTENDNSEITNQAQYLIVSILLLVLGCKGDSLIPD